MAEDGSIVLAGYTVGSWDGSEANAGEEDFVVVKLDKDGNELWHWQVIAGSSTIFRRTAPAGDPTGDVSENFQQEGKCGYFPELPGGRVTTPFRPRDDYFYGPLSVSV